MLKYWFILFIFWGNTPLTSQHLNPQQILNKLITARGEIRADYPNNKIVDRTKSIAAYSTVSNSILLERKALEVIEGMGDQAESALAFLLSHELTHFFQHQVWNNLKTDMSFFTSNEQLAAMKSMEVEADKYGAFLCYLADYPYAQVAPLAIENLYKAYYLENPNLPGYPQPAERKKITQEVCSEVDRFQLLFEAAQVLANFGAYDWSQSIYDYLLRFLDFQEIYNNSAADKIKLVLTQHAKLQYPIVYQKSLTLRSGAFQTKDSLLAQAKQYLVKGIKKDPTNHDLFINLAIVYILTGSSEPFYQLKNQLEAVNLSVENKQRLQILKANLAAIQSDTATAIQLFENVLQGSVSKDIRSICEQNLTWLQAGELIDHHPSNRSFHYPRIRIKPIEKNQRIIDTTDDLFPKKVTFQKFKDYSEILFEDGLQKISLIKALASSSELPASDNSFVLNHMNNNMRFYIKGL